VGVAALAIFLCSWRICLQATFTVPSLTGAKRIRLVTPRHVEAADATTAAVPSLSEAPVFLTEVDPLTGQLDLSGVPNTMGVYAVFDDNSQLQYIGLSKQMSRSVSDHAENIGIQEAGMLISSVKCLEMPDAPKELLKATWEQWIKDHMSNGGEIPAGNLPESAPGADGRWRLRRNQGKPPLNLAGVRGITTQAEALDAVKVAVTRHPIVLFMKGTPVMPQCGFSARSVGIMSSLGIPFDTVNVMDAEANPGVRDAVKEFSKWPTIPQLFVKGQLIGGADIIAEMHASGTLETTLKEATLATEQESEEGTESTSDAAATPVTPGEILLVDNPSRPTASLISRTLNDAFQLHSLRIVDESSAHEGDAGALEMGLTGESHFRVELSAPEFEGLSTLQRHQKVNGVLSEVMPRIHALSLVTQTPAEASSQ